MQIKTLKSTPLPYIMGNGGDLIKHGILAEFANWHRNSLRENLICFDPFGGRPWQSPVNKQVIERIQNLSPCPLKSAHKNIKKQYIGSGHIVQSFNQPEKDVTITVYSSDGDHKAKYDLENSGLSPINLSGFAAEDAYSILDSSFNKNDKTLILIDPFYAIEKLSSDIIPKSIQLIKSSYTSIALYVLYNEEEIELWYDFQEKQKNFTKNNINYISLKCEAIQDSTIKGESKFHSYIALYINKNYHDNHQKELAKQIEQYANNLEHSIGCHIEYGCQI